MTLKTMFRIGKLQYLGGDSEGAMEMLGETLAKQEKLLGFDHAEATLTRDLLNQILGERATAVVTVESNETISDDIPDDIPEDTPLLVFLEQFESAERSFDENTTISSIPSFELNNTILVKEPDPIEEPDPVQEPEQEEEEKKPGFFKRLFSGDSDEEEDSSPDGEEK